MGSSMYLRPLRLDQALPYRVPGEFDPVAHPKLLENVRAVALDGLLGDDQCLGDLLVAVALGDELENLLLPAAEWVLAQGKILARSV